MGSRNECLVCQQSWYFGHLNEIRVLLSRALALRQINRVEKVVWPPQRDTNADVYSVSTRISLRRLASPSQTANICNELLGGISLTNILRLR